MFQAFGVALALALFGWHPAAAPPDVIEDLLKIPAPLPLARPVPQAPPNQLPAAPPADDAPLDVLARYWAQRPDRDPAPGDAARERLLEACEANPEYLPSLLNRVPDSPASYDRIKSILDAEERLPRFSAEWRLRVSRHLMLRSRYFRQELIQAARAAHDEDNSVRGDEELRALARLDWTAAEPVLKSHAASGNARVAAVALTLLYRHYSDAGTQAEANEYRDRLKRIVEDKSSAGRARDTAAEALLTTRWDGRDAWYSSLFTDPSMRELRDGYLAMRPLCTVEMETDEWISVLARLVEDPDRAVHDNAVECLVGFHLENARRDALLPLLPWLKDPKWSSAGDRLRLIQSMDRVEMPEAVPGLIAVLGQDDEYNRSYAAESLAHYKDPRAVPALKRALEIETDWAHRMRIIQGLVACGGVGEDDVVQAIEAFARQIATDKGSEELSRATYDGDAAKRISSSVLAGLYLARSQTPGEAAVQKLLERARGLKSRQPSVAKALFSVVEKWPVRSIDEDLITRIVSRQADASTIHSALLRRDSLRKTVKEQLEAAANGGGLAAGVAAVILADRARISAILRGADSAATRALLACARLSREPLGLPEVGSLLDSGDRFLTSAAEAYLVSEDSATARKLVLARHHGEAILLGARQEYDPGHNTYPAFDLLENQLQQEARDGVEIYALLTAGYWGDAGQTVIRIQGDSAELMFAADPARYYSRRLASAELADLRRFVLSSNIEDQGPLAIPAHDGMQYEYVHVAKDGGRRVFMNNPGAGGTGGSVYDLVCGYFRRLATAGKMELTYRIAGRVPGFEVLLAGGGVSVLSAWSRGGDVRLLVRRGPGNRPAGVAVQEGGSVQITITPSDTERLEWISFADGKPGGPAKTPPEFEHMDVRTDLPPKLEIQEDRHIAPWLLTTGAYSYRIGTWNSKTGLWKGVRGRDPVLVLEGNCAFPIVTPDGRWAVVAKTDESWAEPNYLVRVDLVAGKVTRVTIPAADTLNPVAYVPAHRKVLVQRAKDPDSTGASAKSAGPDRPEFLLLNPETGAAQAVTGEFAPFLEQGDRPLEPAGKSDQVWAAVFNPDAGETRVGRYDTRAFAFHPVLSLPGLRFSSGEMWVDEAEHHIYVAYNGHLLRMRLPRD